MSMSKECRLCGALIREDGSCDCRGNNEPYKVGERYPANSDGSAYYICTTAGTSGDEIVGEGYVNRQARSRQLNIIGINGHIYSGKTTLAQAICEADERFVRLGFADALKNAVAQFCGVERSYLDEHKDQFRELLQVYGTFMRSLKGEQYWVLQLLREIRKRELRYIVIDDMRFLNELAGLRDAATNFMAVRMDISEELQQMRSIEKTGEALSAEKRAHISETALDDYEHLFDTIIPIDIDIVAEPRIYADSVLALLHYKEAQQRAIRSLPV